MLFVQSQLESYLNKERDDFLESLREYDSRKQIERTVELIDEKYRHHEHYEMEYRLPLGNKGYYKSRRRGIILARRIIEIYIDFLTHKINDN